MRHALVTARKTRTRKKKKEKTGVVTHWRTRGGSSFCFCLSSRASSTMTTKYDVNDDVNDDDF